jgi:hypothetical protein
VLEQKICRLRDELNQSLTEEKDYKITYQLSIELDELIAEYYRLKLKNRRIS